MPEVIDNTGYCIDALFYLTDQEIAIHQKFIRSVLLRLFSDGCEGSTSIIASNMRKAFSRIDEALYLNR